MTYAIQTLKRRQIEIEADLYRIRKTASKEDIAEVERKLSEVANAIELLKSVL